MTSTMFRKYYCLIIRQGRQYSTKKDVKPIVMMDKETLEMINNDELKPRKHIGRLPTGMLAYPAWLEEAVSRAIEDMSRPTLLADGNKLLDFLTGRRPPLEAKIVQAKYEAIRSKLASTRKENIDKGKSVEELDAEERQKSLLLLKKSLHRWSAVNYNRYAGLLYLVAKAPHEYAVLSKIFREISVRDKEFHPETIMDFGSGVGCVSWVANHIWPKTIKEHMCIDISEDMINLSELMIDRASPKIKNVFHRQYIPFSQKTYDMVVSAYTLMELPSMESRLETVSKLWARTRKYLVLVEHGTNAGFKMINEARDLIIHMNKANQQVGRIFSPCPHELRCPRYKEGDTPCNFEASYYRFKISKPLKIRTERFCYIVFQKGEFEDKTKDWPRLVRPTLVRSKHIICRMCDKNGKLTEVIFTRFKHGKEMYRCAKASQWGDRLPIDLEIPHLSQDEGERNEEEGKEEEVKERKEEEGKEEEKEGAEEDEEEDLGEEIEWKTSKKKAKTEENHEIK